MTIEEQLKELLNDPIRGLRDSSNTNKTRYSILALLDEKEKEVKEDIEKKIKNEISKYRVAIDEDIKEYINTPNSNTTNNKINVKLEAWEALEYIIKLII